MFTRDDLLLTILYPGGWAFLVLILAWTLSRKRFGTAAWALAVGLTVAVLGRWAVGVTVPFTPTGGRNWVIWAAAVLVPVMLIDGAFRLRPIVRIVGLVVVTAMVMPAMTWRMISSNPATGTSIWTGSETAWYVGVPVLIAVMHAVSINCLGRRQTGWLLPWIYMATLGTAALILGSRVSKSSADLTAILASVMGAAWVVGIILPRLCLSYGGAVGVAVLGTVVIASGWWFGSSVTTPLPIGADLFPTVEVSRDGPMLLWLAAAPLAAWLVYLIPPVARYERVAALTQAGLVLTTLAWPIYTGIVELRQTAETFGLY